MDSPRTLEEGLARSDTISSPTFSRADTFVNNELPSVSEKEADHYFNANQIQYSQPVEQPESRGGWLGRWTRGRAPVDLGRIQTETRPPLEIRPCMFAQDFPIALLLTTRSGEIS